MVLVIILICTNIFLVLVSQAVNKDNADLLLSGYNTMSKTQKENFKLEEYLVYFKKFFFQLALYSSLATIIRYILFDVFNIGVWFSHSYSYHDYVEL